MFKIIGFTLVGLAGIVILLLGLGQAYKLADAGTTVLPPASPGFLEIPVVAQAEAVPEAMPATVLDSSATPQPKGVFVSKEQYGEDWPFIVESGYVDCDRLASIFRHDGKIYTLNGGGKDWGYLPLQNIWRDNPQLSGTKVNIGPMIQLGLGQCNPPVTTPAARTPVLSQPAKPAQALIRILSDPPAAQVYIDGSYQGLTPLAVHMPAGTTVRYRVEADEALYLPYEGTLEFDREKNISIWLDRVNAGESNVTLESQETPTTQDTDYRIDCARFDFFGRGELGVEPSWAIPYCTGTAELTEGGIAASRNDIIFMDSYEALISGTAFGSYVTGGQAAQDIQAKMAAAGYVQVSSETVNGKVTTTFANRVKGTAFIVEVWKKPDDFYLLLMKVRL